MSDAKKDPLLVTMPDVLGRISHDQKLIGKNAERLRKTIKREHGRSDEDVESMGRMELMREVVKLRAGIRADMAATGHMLCWYRPELWKLLPEYEKPKPEVPPREEFLQRCAEFRDSLDKPLRKKR